MVLIKMLGNIFLCDIAYQEMIICGRAHATGVPTNNRGVTFYLFMPDQRDMIPFFSSQN